MSWYVERLASSTAGLVKRFVFPALGVAVVAAAIYLLVWLVPKREVDPWRQHLDAQQELAAEDAVRRTIVQVIGGAFLLLGLYFTWQNVLIAREGKITDRFSKAVDQLGNDKLDVRLGGIYALERIDRDSGKDHWTIVEVLCAFIRERTHTPSPKVRPQGRLGTSRIDWRERRPSPDVQAACTVLGRRPWRSTERIGLNLNEVHLEGVDWKEAHLERAHLGGSRLERAFLQGVHLEDATLIATHLEGADLVEAHLEGVVAVEAHLEHADLSHANLRRAILDEAHMAHARLFLTRIEGAYLDDVDGLTLDQVTDALIDENTKVPESLVAALRPVEPKGQDPKPG